MSNLVADHDVDDILGELEDEDDGASHEIIDAVAVEPGDEDDELATAFTDLDWAQHENIDLADEFFGNSPVDLGPQKLPFHDESPDVPDTEAVIGALDEVDATLETVTFTDLDRSQDENPDLAAQFFGNSPVDLGPQKLPFSDETPDAPVTEAVVGEESEGEWAEILREAGHIGGVIGEIGAASPAFRQYVEERYAASRPLLAKNPRAIERLRDYTIDFGPMYSPAAGEVIELYATPQVPFRGEKIVATDTASPPGTGTMIQNVLVGNMLQRPANTMSLTAFFAQQALGNGIKFDTTEPAITITVTVSFIQAVTFFMTVFGKALTA